ncbi:amidase domain-containing protein [Candidatus Woesearchaeota archaeon]|nr:amidase domain-containing protein [Candidatus Woesearchaeota archaeon]
MKQVGTKDCLGFCTKIKRRYRIRDFKRPPDFYPVIRPRPKPLPKPKVQPLYSRTAVVGYADKFWDVYNTAYHDYSSSGGDDCNFVSQCMIAGGLSLWKGYDGAGGGVDSKGAIPFSDNLHSFLVNQLGADHSYIEYSVSAPDWLAPGDIIIYGDARDQINPDYWRHAVIVVEGCGNNAKVSAHTSDRYHEPWNYAFPSCFNRANFYHIPDGKITEYTQFRVNVTALSVRVGPSTSYGTIGQVNLNEKYIAYEYVIDAAGAKWWHFWFDNRSAWCRADYTEIVNENIKFKVVSENYLNVRAGPGTTNSNVGSIFYAQAFTAFETAIAADNSTWYRFYCQGRSDLWCCADYTVVIE